MVTVHQSQQRRPASACGLSSHRAADPSSQLPPLQPFRAAQQASTPLPSPRSSLSGSEGTAAHAEHLRSRHRQWQYAEALGNPLPQKGRAPDALDLALSHQQAVSVGCALLLESKLPVPAD
jgi:hypothetical protein